MKKIFAIIIFIISILAAVFLGISATHSNTTGDIIKNNLSSILENEPSDSGSENNNDIISNLVNGLASTVVDAVSDKLDEIEEISQLLSVYKLSLIIPCVLSIVAGILTLVPLKRIKYLISSILSLIGCALLIMTDLFYIPKRLGSLIPDVVSSYVSVDFKDIVKIVINSSGITVVVGVVFMVVSVVLGLIAFALSHD